MRLSRPIVIRFPGETRDYVAVIRIVVDPCHVRVECGHRDVPESHGVLPVVRGVLVARYAI